MHGPNGANYANESVFREIQHLDRLHDGNRPNPRSGSGRGNS
jgi:hypothetical protein